MKAKELLLQAGRWVFFVLGVALNSFGIALITKGALGTSPISSLPYVLSMQFPFTLGATSFVVNMLFILGQVLLLRHDFQKFQVLQVLVDVVFSALIDVSMALLAWFEPTGIVEGLAAVVAGSVVLGFGVSVEVAPNVLMVPGEGLVRAISTTTHKRFGSVKIAFDCSLVVLAVICSLIFFFELRGVGLGTLISALLVGQVVNFCNKHIPLLGFIVNLRIHADEMRDARKAAKAQAGE